VGPAVHHHPAGSTCRARACEVLLTWHMALGRTAVPVLRGFRSTDSYDISAKAEGNPPLDQMVGPMLQALLEDRFQLKIHRETREIPMYALTVAKGGPKLRPFVEGSCTPFDLTKPPAGIDAAMCRSALWRSGPGVMTMEFQGRFDVHLEFAPDQVTPGFLPGGGNPPAAPDTGGPSIFTALQEQLGLKLESTKGPGDFLVMDHVERPSEN
jgi:uncharacterized protein (TIGR03435 family)